MEPRGGDIARSYDGRQRLRWASDRRIGKRIGKRIGLTRPPAMVVGGEGRESNPPSTVEADITVLKTGRATGPVPSPLIYLRRSITTMWSISYGQMTNSASRARVYACLEQRWER